MAGKGAQTNPDAPEKIRLDKWLWQARFFKTRALATAQITKGRVRLNGQPQRKPGHGIGAGDTLTFPQGDRIRVIRIAALGSRRGPATEAASLFVDLDPQPDLPSASTALE